MQVCGRAYEEGAAGCKGKGRCRLEAYSGDPNCIPERSRHLAVARTPAK